MLVGALLGYLLGYTEKKKEKFSHKVLAMICLAATAFSTLVLSERNTVSISPLEY